VISALSPYCFFQISNSDVQPGFLKRPLDFCRAEVDNLDHNMRMVLLKKGRNLGSHGNCRRDNSDLQMAQGVPPLALEIPAEMFAFDRHSMGKREHALTSFGKAAIPLAPFQDHDSHLSLQLTQCGRESGLGYMTSFGGSAKVSLLR
jgi:hypothetical protein